MCGRFTLTRRDFDMLAAELGAEAPADVKSLYRPRYNIAPTNWHWLLRNEHERRELLPARWGLVNSWAKDAKGAARQINARSETVATSRAYRPALVARRCAVPADGFFEWTGAKTARRPIWFHAPDGVLLMFAGLYESWLDPATSDRLRTFTILTTDANETVAPVHDRMPVILPSDRVDDWLFVPAENREQQAESVVGLLRPAVAGVLVATEVSPRVNSPANDDEACLAPAVGGGDGAAALR
jgi:putative SOS response-associated peptidase YedK